jgi:hypothetical protein
VPSFPDPRVPVTAVECACLAILALGVFLRRRLPGWSDWKRDAVPVFLGAWLAEASCITAYGFYDYSPRWHAFVGTVPLLVPAIWIFVVLSARDVAANLGLPAWCAGLLVWYDASLIEPTATHAGLWRWHEAGPFAVPWIGTLGWGLYAVAAILWRQRLGDRWRWWLLVLAPLTTHFLLLAVWWGALRWIGRTVPEPWTVALGSWLVAAVLAGVLWRAGRTLDWRVALPRVAPAGFFFALLAWSSADGVLWTYAGAFALPWLAVLVHRPGT